MRELAPISGHRLFQDGPLLVYRQHENFTLGDAQASTAVYSQVIAADGYLLLLLDFRHGGSADAEVRRHLAHWGKENADRLCIAALGGNFMLRTTLTLVLTAAKVMGGKQPQVQFFGNEEDALAWLASCGANLSIALHSSPKP